FAMAEQHISFTQVDLAGAQRFHFPALKHEPRLEALLEMVFVSGLAVLGDTAGACAFLCIAHRGASGGQGQAERTHLSPRCLSSLPVLRTMAACFDGDSA